jgi:hypothetical protein
MGFPDQCYGLLGKPGLAQRKQSPDGKTGEVDR